MDVLRDGAPMTEQLCQWCGADMQDPELGECDACHVFGPPCKECRRRGWAHWSGCSLAPTLREEAAREEGRRGDVAHD